MRKGRWAVGRHGANAVEFALVAPILVAMLGGMIDYGWYFWREALAVNALHEGLRSGSMKTPDPQTESLGQCGACVEQAQAAVGEGLNELGFTGYKVVVDIERMPTSGTPCTYALVAEASVPHKRIMPIVPGQDQFHVRVVSMAQAMACE